MMPQALAEAATLASAEARDGGSPRRVDEPDVGAQVGRYVILARLGEGAMGEVFAGYDRELDRRVALKLLRGQADGDAPARARMQREAQALARLSHPNVVQVHDVGELGGRLFVAMEYVEGETLGAWQRRHDPRTAGGRAAILGAYMQAGRGLAAAHAAGIVHRDFKPSNALVGDDGRTRVLDFGLAGPQPGEIEHIDAMITASSGVNPGFQADITRTGSVLGTPAYMAPEQFMAGATDPRTDVFAFSVALYEALHGEPPFLGDSFVDRRQAVLVGDLRPPAPGSDVPAWLRAVLIRGLEFDPRARHGSMDALLAALADDPEARARRRRRLVGAAALALVVAAALVVAGQWGWRRWQRAADEARAADRLAALEQRVAAALAVGADDEAERAFAGFVAHPDNRGTAAVGRAWLRRAERAQARGDAAAALDALAGAHVGATTAEDQARARVALARAFRDEMQWAGLQLAVAALAEPGAIGVDADELAELRLDAALAGRDLAAATSLLRGPLAGSPRAAALPVLAALQAATPTEHVHRGAAVIADVDGDGRQDIALATDAIERQIAPLLRAEPTLPRIATLDLEAGRFAALAPGPGEPALLVTAARRLVDGATVREAVARRWQDGRLVEVHRWPEHPILTALATDLDGDGARELLLGSGPYTRRISRLSRGTGGAWQVRDAAPEVARRRSDVVDLLADDLDGDGAPEVVAALGPWYGYELELLRRDPASDELRVVTRRRLGDLAGAALIRRGPGPPEVVVSKTDEHRNSQVFPADRPLGEPAGVYLFRLVDGGFAQSGFAAAPRRIAGPVAYGRPLVGDLDGDGRDELIVGAAVADRHAADSRDITTIFVAAADGALVPLVLGDLRPIAAIDLDGDGDVELIVSDSGAAPADRVWVLGSGPASPPILGPAPPTRTSDPPADPALARMWASADELARMGLVRQAADHLTAAADVVADPDLRARAAVRAGQLLVGLADDHRAAALFARAAREPALAAEAHAEAARAYLRGGRLDEAAVHLAAVADPPAPLVAALAALHGEPGADLDFTRPLADVWRVGQPLVLRRDGARGRLHIDATIPGELLAAPVRWSGGAAILEVDLDLERVEWDSGLELGLVRVGAGLDDPGGPLGVDIRTTGGGDLRTLELACTSHGRRSVARTTRGVGDRAAPGRVRVRVVLLPELGEWTCAVERPGAPTHYGRMQLAPGAAASGPLQLAVTASGGAGAWVRAGVERVNLVGVALAPAAAPADPAARAFIEDDPLAALAELAGRGDPSPGERLLATAAHARLGHLREAAEALAPVVAEEALVFPLRALLRSEPAVIGAVLRAAAGPAVQRERLADAWSGGVLEARDPHAYAVAWTGLAELDRAADPYEVLRVHAVAAAALGHREAARASHRAALAALADPDRCAALEPAVREREAVSLRLDLAALALAAGDVDAARRELRPHVSGPAADPYFVDRLRARADLQALHDLAP